MTRFTRARKERVCGKGYIACSTYLKMPFFLPPKGILFLLWFRWR